MPSATWPFRLRRGWNTALNWIFPGDHLPCVLCRRPVPPEVAQTGDVHLCPFCFQDIAQIRVSGRVRRLTFAGEGIPVVAAVRHDGFVRNLIRQWKYDGAIELTEWFADWASMAWREVHGTAFRQGQAVAPAPAPSPEPMQMQAPMPGTRPHPRGAAPLCTSGMPDALVPVPPAPDRLRQRGYDHTALLAGCLSRHLGIPVLHALARAGAAGAITRSQTAKARRDRIMSLEGAFRLARQAPSLRGRRLLLVDDVVTTGATLSACAKVLTAAGARSVAGIVVADVA
ncbi:ComF family protein [Alicyclobacillus macrosporangiidus]|uniref:ComF family protein n=1 Tax=Alicyclobacillus macrosporangiidus TaxID=392015 RepID=A0A1I7LDZ7_9BACL|nr:phosphoribosyltransferase family protein [Alicyclobacillus macrosporangiidus]SFV07911.1 comF family protein [Alicyclobacillus macrosporangiidus]